MSNPTRIQAKLDEAARTFVFSGYQLYAECDGKELDLAGGITSYWPGGQPVSPATLFDIGSVTKAVCTTSLVALAVQADELSLGDRVSERLTDLRHTCLHDIRLEHLLTHSSGLAPNFPVHEHTDKAGLVKWFARHADQLVEAKPGARTAYSDLGFLLIGEILEKAGMDLGRAFQTKVARPLGLNDAVFGPLPPQKKAPEQPGSATERRTDKGRESGDAVRWSADCAATEYSLDRGRVLQGEVFDDKAYGLGGKTAHAGLFASARGLAGICREWLKARQGRSDWLNRDIATRFTRPVGLVAGSTWGYGWDTRSQHNSTAGSLFSLQSFGHLGYPGTSIWIDPEVFGFAIFFTNHIHPSRLDPRIRQVRPAVHDMIAEFWRSS